jgi:hypothetical protein
MRGFCGFALIAVVEKQFEGVTGLPRRLAPPRNDGEGAVAVIASGSVANQGRGVRAAAIYLTVVSGLPRRLCRLAMTG